LLFDEPLVFTVDPMIANVSFFLWAFVTWPFFALFGYYFLKEAKQKKTFFSLCVGLLFVLFLGASICRTVNKHIFLLPWDTLHYEGINLILISMYATLAFSSLFFIYLAIERDIIKRTHHILSILALTTLFLSVLNYWLPEEISVPYFTMYVVYPLWIPTLLALPIIYVVLAIKSTGVVRKNAILVLLGITAFEFLIAFNSPEATPVFIGLGPYILWWGTPIFNVLAVYLLYRGFKMK
jgi:hypothetical protein